MKEFNEKVIESVDVETIPEKTEEDQTSAWSDESEFSIGQSVKKKAGNYNAFLTVAGSQREWPA